LPAVDDFFDLYVDGRFIHHFGTPDEPCWGKITRVDVTACTTSGCRHPVWLRVEDTGMPGGLCGAPCTLSAQMPIYWLAKDRDYAYLYEDRPEGAPHIGPCPRETAIEGQSFRGMPPELLHGQNVSWSLAHGPLGLRIDPNTGTISWDEPTTGPEAFLDQDRRWDHPVTVKAQNEFGYDYATFQLKTLDNKGPALQRIRTQYINWIVTERIAAWFEATRPQEVIDRQWELMRDVIGHEPSYGRQSVKYQYNIDGRAWSGSPAIVGPGLWSTDLVDGWSPGIWLHEVGHNFNWQTPVDKVVFGPLDGWYHHFVEVLIQYVLHYSIEHPGQFALSGEKLATPTARESSSGICVRAVPQLPDLGEGQRQCSRFSRRSVRGLEGTPGWLQDTQLQRSGHALRDRRSRGIAPDRRPRLHRDLLTRAQVRQSFS